MGGKTEVKQTRKSTFRPLNQMNGDYLTNLKRPRCSEIEGTVKGMNQAKLSELKKRLDLWYRERNINLSKVQRGQDEIYGVMLKVHKEKKKLQRQAYLVQQEGTRVNHEQQRAQLESNILSLDVKEKKVSPPRITPADPISTVQVANAVKAKTTTVHKKGTIIPGSKVLEVKKGNMLEPMVRERSISDPKDLEAEKSSLSQFSDIRDTLDKRFDDFEAEAELSSSNHLPQIAEKSQIKSKPKPRKRSNAGMPTIAESSWSPDRWANHNTPGYDPRNLLADPLRQSVSNGRADFVRRSTGSDMDALVTKRQWSDGDLNLHSDTVTSLVELNKKKAKRREKMRKELLDKEPFVTYTKNKRGEIIPADCPFKRKDFEPPSMRETHFRRKMLDAQVEARDQQREKLEGFFDKINAADREKANRLRDAKRQAVLAAEAEEETRRYARSKGTFSMSISQMMQVFEQSSLPEGVEPGSYEALKYCAYIRSHSPLIQQEKDAALNNKVSSWGHTLN